MLPHPTLLGRPWNLQLLLVGSENPQRLRLRKFQGPRCVSFQIRIHLVLGGILRGLIQQQLDVDNLYLEYDQLR